MNIDENIFKPNTHEEKPLYRKEKKTGLMTQYYVNRGGEYRWERSKSVTPNRVYDALKQQMKSRKLGMDWQPLYNFIMSNVGCNYDETYSKALKRCNKFRDEFNKHWAYLFNDDRDIVRLGENTYYSALTIDEFNNIQIRNTGAEPIKGGSFSFGYTHSFNGKTLQANPIPSFIRINNMHRPSEFLSESQMQKVGILDETNYCTKTMDGFYVWIDDKIIGVIKKIIRYKKSKDSTEKIIRYKFIKGDNFVWSSSYKSEPFCMKTSLIPKENKEFNETLKKRKELYRQQKKAYKIISLQDKYTPTSQDLPDPNA